MDNKNQNDQTHDHSHDDDDECCGGTGINCKCQGEEHSHDHKHESECCHGEGEDCCHGAEECCEHDHDEEHGHNHKHDESEMEANWKRALADYQNLQKRVLEEREAILSFANSILLMKLLPIMDNLEMLEKHSADEGLKMTLKEFRKVLAEEGVTEIDVDGKEFDSQKMDAIEKVSGEENKVIEVLQKGYTFKNKILRPARVKVGGKKEE